MRNRRGLGCSNHGKDFHSCNVVLQKDEKWVYNHKINQKCYLFAERNGNIFVENWTCIKNVRFFPAVPRYRWDSSSNFLF